MKNDDMRMGLVTGCGVVGGGIGWGNLWEDGVMVWGGGGGAGRGGGAGVWGGGGGGPAAGPRAR